jgi:hypothetical protein
MLRMTRRARFGGITIAPRGRAGAAQFKLVRAVVF